MFGFRERGIKWEDGVDIWTKIFGIKKLYSQHRTLKNGAMVMMMMMIMNYFLNEYLITFST